MSWDDTITDDDGNFETTFSHHLRKTGILDALLFLLSARDWKCLKALLGMREGRRQVSTH